MNFSGLPGSNIRKPPTPQSNIGQESSSGPQPSSLWECPARYETNHKHQDGRPLCRYCECWNPAPFPDGHMPTQTPSSTTMVVPSSSISLSRFQTSHLDLRPSLPQFPSEVESASIYSGYNLPPAPESILSLNPVRIVLFQLFVPFLVRVTTTKTNITLSHHFLPLCQI